MIPNRIFTGASPLRVLVLGLLAGGICPLTRVQAADGALSTLATALDEPVRSLFPPTTPDVHAHPVTELIFESLLGRDPVDYSLQPLLARSWSISADGLTYTFELDDAARFADGSPVTAADVVFSWNIYDLEGVDTEPWSSHYLFIESMTATTSRRVEVRVYRAAWRHFVAVASMPVYPASHYQQLRKADPGLRRTGSVMEPLGSGPFVLESASRDEVVLKRNDRYWRRGRHVRDGIFPYERRVFRTIPAFDDKVRALLGGRIHFLGLTKEEWVRTEGHLDWPIDLVRVKAATRAPPSYDFIAWNHRHHALHSSRARWAMSHLVPLAEWIERFDVGLTEPAIGPFSPKGPCHSAKAAAVAYDLAEARRRLELDGWDKLDRDGIRIRDGKRFEVEIMYPATGPGSYGPKIQSLAVEALKAGIKVTPRPATWQEIQQATATGRFDAVVAAWTRSPDQEVRRMFHSESIPEGRDNFPHYRNSHADKLIDAYDAASDPAERLRLCRLLQEQIYENQAYTFLTEYKYVFYAHRPEVTKHQDSLPFRIGLDRWRVAVPVAKGR